MVKTFPVANSHVWPSFAIAVILIAQSTMVFTRAINWDEFYYMSQIGSFLRGDLTTALQTIHVRIFSFLPAITDNSVDAIVAGRVMMFAYEVGTIACIYASARRFADKTGALLSALCYISAGFVLQHGFSFRVDPGATFSLMAALAILLRTRLGWPHALVAACFIAFGTMITIKSIFYAPAFLGVAWLRWNDEGRSRRCATKLLTTGVLSLALFAAAYLLHAYGLGMAAAGNAGTAHKATQGLLSNAGNALFFIGMPPYAHIIAKAVSIAIPFTILIAITPYAILRSPIQASEKIALSSMLATALTLLFYRNTAPYFYAFMLAPVAVAVSPAIGLARERFPAGALVAIMLLLALPVLILEDRSTITNQRKVVSVTEKIFDEPVFYFDHNGMIAPFRKANAFMTPWGLESYHARGHATYVETMKNEVVPLLLENDELLTIALRHPAEPSVLLKADRFALVDNYVHIWGPVWLAGKAIPAGELLETAFLVPGTYKADGASIIVDGEILRAGDQRMIDRGRHTLSAEGPGGRLVWAEVATMPDGPEPDGRIWIGF